MNTFLVYYYKTLEDDRVRNLLWSENLIDMFSLNETHTFVALVQAETLEDVFIKMQGENWSPCGEACRVIEGAGTYHTSMSVGDVAYVVERGSWFQVMDRGFAQIGTGPMPQIDMLVRY
jgi:hypothetical protein